MERNDQLVIDLMIDAQIEDAQIENALIEQLIEELRTWPSTLSRETQNKIASMKSSRERAVLYNTK